jgi:SAM-dependent methyltransferase
MSLSRDALAIYAAHGAALAERYEAVDPAETLAPVADLLPPPQVRVLDVGAGSGRDAAYLSALGHRVTALEPTPALRHDGQGRYPALEWLDDRLPDMASLGTRRFGVVLANAVWHHLDTSERDAALARVAGLLETGGLLILSLRQGAVPSGQPVTAVSAPAEIDRAAAAGFTCLRDAAAPPRRDAPGIGWRWLVLQRSPT